MPARGDVWIEHSVYHRAVESRADGNPESRVLIIFGVEKMTGGVTSGMGAWALHGVPGYIA